jgi:hypothetical protein
MSRQESNPQVVNQFARAYRRKSRYEHDQRQAKARKRRVRKTGAHGVKDRAAVVSPVTASVADPLKLILSALIDPDTGGMV